VIKLNKAVKIALQALDDADKRDAVNANLFLVCGMESGRHSHEHRQQRQEAREALTALLDPVANLPLFGGAE
jgi:20S proteasome alpha/beta subunit